MQETHRREAADLNLREAFTNELALEAKARDAEDVALGAQAAAAEYGQSTFGDDWLPIGDHGGSCNNGYCIDAHIDLGHQAFNDCSTENVPLPGFALPLPGFTVPLPGFALPLPGFKCPLFEGGVRWKKLWRARHPKSIASHH